MDFIFIDNDGHSLLTAHDQLFWHMDTLFREKDKQLFGV
jgi:hypothetical protein